MARMGRAWRAAGALCAAALILGAVSPASARPSKHARAPYQEPWTHRRTETDGLAGSVAGATSSATVGGRLRAVATAKSNDLLGLYFHDPPAGAFYPLLGPAASSLAEASIMTREIRITTTRARAVAHFHGLSYATVASKIGSADASVSIRIELCIRDHFCGLIGQMSPAGDQVGPLPAEARSVGEDSFDVPFLIDTHASKCPASVFQIRVTLSAMAASKRQGQSRAQGDLYLDSISFEDIQC